MNIICLYMLLRLTLKVFDNITKNSEEEVARDRECHSCLCLLIFLSLSLAYQNTTLSFQFLFNG